MVFSHILTKADEDFAKRLDLEDKKLIIKSCRKTFVSLLFTSFHFRRNIKTLY